MSELKFYELKCQRCGGELDPLSGGMYRCKSCGKAFKEQLVEDVADKLRNVLNEQKQESIANLRQQLWTEMHEQYINSNKIVGLARDIKKYLPDDYFANFCEVANSGNDRQVSSFLNNTSKADMADYADVVLDFMLKSVTAGNLNAISLFIERAFKGDTTNKGDTVSYDKYVTAYEREAQKVKNGIYELNITRDVFLAYSSADIEKVLELCDYLERNKITCFLALRNLRHGRGAIDTYDQTIKTAIDNCKTVVFVSSTHSRDMSCDAFTDELPYIRQKDLNVAPPQFRYVYDKLPQEYMMPRVEYLIEDYCGNIAERTVKEFFHGLEWCKNKEDVADRIVKYLTLAPVKPAEEPVIVHTEKPATTQNLSITADQFKDGVKVCKKCGTAVKQSIKFCVNCGNSQFYNNYEEYRTTTIKYCAKCGRINEENYRCCPECGSFEFVGYEEHMRREEKKRNAILNIGNYKDIGGGYVTFSTYPQSKKADNVTIGEIFDKERGYYLGSDNNLYEEYEDEYYKVEPIKWKVLQSGNEIFVIADDILDAHRFAENSSNNYAGGSNNYAHSDVRQFLNSDFYSKAFNDSQRAKIVTTTVDNSLSSTGDSSNDYTCSNTSDKVFLLSRREAEQYMADNEARKRVPTDYALARGAYQYSQGSKYWRNGKECGWWWLRSPYGNSGTAQHVDGDGSFGCNRVYSTNTGMVPALKFSLSEEERTAYESEQKKIREEESKKFSSDFEIKDGVLVRYKGKGGDIVIPENVKIIGQSAFYDCKTLTNVTIDDNVTEISITAFWGCGYLIGVNIGKNVAKISSDVFTRCLKLAKIIVDTDNKSFKSFAGNLYTRDGKVLIKYASGKAVGLFSVLDSVQTISDSAFNGCRDLIKIPASVKNIGDFAFSDCQKNSTIVIPSGITHMGKYVFNGCTNLNTIYCCDKKPLFGLPAGWDKEWLGGCNAKVIWNWKY